MLILYNIVIIISSFFLSTFLTYRVFSKYKYRFGIKQRLGFFHKDLLAKRTKKPLIWIQAVSVGEVLAAKSLIERIRQEFPNYQLLLSTTTLTGHNICIQKVARNDDIIIFFPLDYFWIIKKVLRLFSPSLIALIETELWPNFICTAARRGISLVLVNGRISEKSYHGYLRFRFLMRKVLQNFTSFGMQTEADAQRIITIGAPKEKVVITHSLKYEGAMQLDSKELKTKNILEELKIPEDAKILTAGSTHYYEEEILTDIYLNLKNEFPGLILLLAPRHPERIPKIETYLSGRGLKYNLRSKLDDGKTPFQPVIVVDTLGELAKYYKISSVVFVGKSLTEKGGHNPIEPAVFARPIIFGPYMDNFREAAQLLLENNAAIEVQSAKELNQAIRRILLNPEEGKEMGIRARNAIKNKTGAIQNSIFQMKKALV